MRARDVTSGNTGHERGALRAPRPATGHSSYTTFEDLLSHGDWLEVDGARFRVLSLPRLIVVKEQLDRTKDHAMLALLRASLEELQKRGP